MIVNLLVVAVSLLGIALILHLFQIEIEEGMREDSHD